MQKINRDNLNFKDEVRKSFKFLNELGFVETEALNTYVEYQSNNIKLAVYHGRLSYEISVDITIMGNEFSLGELLGVLDSDFAKEFKYPTAVTKKSVISAVNLVAHIINKHIGSLIKNNLKLIEILQIQRKLMTEEYALDVLVRQTRPRAIEAFQKGDYLKVVELYEQISDQLTDSERKRYEIAKKRSKL